MTLSTLKAYLDLTRLHFFFVWPLLFCSGLFLSFARYGGFSWFLVLRAALIALLGFEAGFVLNDYVDREVDKKDVEHDKLTKYWRPFGQRPIISGDISPSRAIILFFVLVGATSALIFTLPFPNSAYVFVIMVYSYLMERFYQVKKRDQRHPIAQLLGRTDFSLFPVAGYLCNGRPDVTALLYFLYFYPFAQAHLGANDIIDVANDEAREMNTIPVLYGLKGTKYWILFFTLLHFLGALFFMQVVGSITSYGMFISLLLLLLANIIILRRDSSVAWLRVLPLFHVAMLVSIIAMIVDYFI
ncbi:MAG: UbiA family prenyltransferase [Candidatus Bathyarchaeota archaeon]|nr:MAG: UbiA family prenyltransferase [Candidatus Bathyarchaeota archaeon]